LQYTGNLERSLNVVSPYFDIGCMHSDARIHVQLQNRYAYPRPCYMACV